MFRKEPTPVLKDFLRLNDNVTVHDYDLNAFRAALKKEHIRDCKIRPVEINPETIQITKIKEKHFSHVSFLGKKFHDLNFYDCEFEGCIFTYASFLDCEFHNCRFFDCNFSKTRFQRVYGHPKQFHEANFRKQYSNIAVGFYRSLLDNYSNESQRDFKLEADFYFRRWRRIHIWNEATRVYPHRKKQSFMGWFFPYVGMYIQEKCFGYGWKIRPMLITVGAVVLFLTLLNLYCTPWMFQNSQEMTFLKAFYFTFTTMSTLGAAGFEPNTNCGYTIVTVDVMAGLFLLTNVVSAAFKRIIP